MLFFFFEFSYFNHVSKIFQELQRNPFVETRAQQPDLPSIELRLPMLLFFVASYLVVNALELQ